MAWLIFRFDSYECTYLNNLLVRNSDEVSHDYFKWVVEIAYAIEFYSSWNFTKRSRYFGFYWKDNLENAYAQVWLMWYGIYDMTQFFCEMFSNSVIFLLIFNDVMIVTSFIPVKLPEFYLLSFARGALFVQKNVEINL